MNRRKPDKIDTKEYGKMLRRILSFCPSIFRPLAFWACTLPSSRMRVTKKECKRLREELEVGDLMAQKRLWHLANRRMLDDRGAVPKEEGDLMR